MELWIRSQDKSSLMKVNKLTFGINIDDEPTIYGYERYDNYERLGTYKTKERALEVLDEIQKIINGEIAMQKSVESQIVGCVKLIALNVYEMPEE